MNKKIKTEAVDHLFDAILSLQNKEECYAFFEDLCTVNELLSLSQRFEVAAMLKEGKTYLDIAVSTLWPPLSIAPASWTPICPVSAAITPSKGFKNPRITVAFVWVPPTRK